MKSEFYKMFFESWDEGTDELTLEQEAAYLRICHQMYRRKGPVANQDRTLCRLWRCHQNKMRVIRAALIAKGKIELTADGMITNPRVMKEIQARFSPPKKGSGNRDTVGTQSGHTRHTPGRQSGDTRETPGTQGTPFPANPLENNNLPREEKRREEERIEEERREKGLLPNPLSTEELAPENLAFLDGLFGSAGADPAAATAGDLPVEDTPVAEVEEPPIEEATEHKPAKLRHPPEAYFIMQEDGFRVLHKDIELWQKAYPHINVAGEVMAASGWAITNLGKTWYHPLKTYLGKRDREAKAANDGRKVQVEAVAKAAVAPPRSRFQI